VRRATRGWHAAPASSCAIASIVGSCLLEQERAHRGAHHEETRDTEFEWVVGVGGQSQEDRTPAVQCRERNRQLSKRIQDSLYTLTLTDGATGWTECLTLLQPQIRR